MLSVRSLRAGSGQYAIGGAGADGDVDDVRRAAGELRRADEVGQRVIDERQMREAQEVALRQGDARCGPVHQENPLFL